MRYSRRYDFQGHPSQGQGQEMTSVPYRDYFCILLPSVPNTQAHRPQTTLRAISVAVAPASTHGVRTMRPEHGSFSRIRQVAPIITSSNLGPTRVCPQTVDRFTELQS